MSLIKCPECKKKISDTVSFCPNCGATITDHIKEQRIFYLRRGLKCADSGRLHNNFAVYVQLSSCGGKTCENTEADE